MVPVQELVRPQMSEELTWVVGVTNDTDDYNT